MHRADPAFLRLLKGYDVSELDAHAGTAYGLWPDWRIAYVNPAWFRFADENHGGEQFRDEWSLGSNLMKAMSAALLDFYRNAYSACLEGGRTWTHDYECSSARDYQRFRQVVYPLGKSDGLLIVNRLSLSRPHEPLKRPCFAADCSYYQDPNGFVHQCSHCRMMKRQGPEQRWEWVPEWVTRSPDNTSHTLCASCLGYYESMVSW